VQLTANKQGDNKENQSNNESQICKLQTTDNQQAPKKGRRHYSEAYLPMIRSDIKPAEQILNISKNESLERVQEAQKTHQSVIGEDHASCLKDLRRNIYK